MNQNSRSFEDELSSLKVDVAVIRSNYVTKSDLQDVRIELKTEIERLRTEIQEMGSDFHKALHAQTWRMYGFAIVLVTAVYFVTRAGY